MVDDDEEVDDREEDDDSEYEDEDYGDDQDPPDRSMVTPTEDPTDAHKTETIDENEK